MNDKTNLPPRQIDLVKQTWLRVMSLERCESRIPTLRILGSQHVSYGVKDEHYDQFE